MFRSIQPTVYKATSQTILCTFRKIAFIRYTDQALLPYSYTWKGTPWSAERI